MLIIFLPIILSFMSDYDKQFCQNKFSRFASKPGEVKRYVFKTDVACFRCLEGKVERKRRTSSGGLGWVKTRPKPLSYFHSYNLQTEPPDRA